MSGLGLHSCPQEELSRSDDKYNPDREKVASSEQEAEKEMSGRKDVQTNSRQQEGLPRFNDVKGKPDQEKVGSPDRDAKRNSRERNVKAERVSRIRAVNGRVKGVVKRRSYRFFPPFKTSVTRLARALLVYKEYNGMRMHTTCTLYRYR